MRDDTCALGEGDLRRHGDLVVFLLFSLKRGWLNNFFYDTSHSPMPGMDFFSVERGWMNLLAGRSEFHTFHSSFGPYGSWLKYHPMLAVVIGAPLMLFPRGSDMRCG